MGQNESKTWTIIGPLGDCVVQAQTPQLAACMYPTLKAWKQSLPTKCVVTVQETGQKFHVQPMLTFSAVEVLSNN